MYAAPPVAYGGQPMYAAPPVAYGGQPPVYGAPYGAQPGPYAAPPVPYGGMAPPQYAPVAVAPQPRPQQGATVTVVEQNGGLFPPTTETVVVSVSDRGGRWRRVSEEFDVKGGGLCRVEPTRTAGRLPPSSLRGTVTTATTTLRP
jgi:hypothetical protein